MVTQSVTPPPAEIEAPHAPLSEELDIATVRDSRSTALHFEVAPTLDAVIEAWSLVYHAYRRINIIDPNPYEVHAIEHAVGNHAAVMAGKLGTQVVCTLTGMTDTGHGLPLDRIYPAELASLRANGRRLCEVGLFADRREHLSRSMASLFELMRMVIYFAVSANATDIVIGVHPHHAPFYRRALAFKPIGERSSHPGVNDAPVVPLCMDLARLHVQPMPKVLAFVTERPLGTEAFANRFDFNATAMSGSRLENYLIHKSASPTACDASRL